MVKTPSPHCLWWQRRHLPKSKIIVLAFLSMLLEDRGHIRRLAQLPVRL